MTPILSSLKAAAERATPGPWIRSGVRRTINENCIMVGPDGFLILALPVGKHPKEHAGAFNDAGFIALANPQTILALIAVVDANRALATKLREIEEHPAFKSLFVLGYTHGMEYNGPNYSDEIAAAELALTHLDTLA